MTCDEIHEQIQNLYTAPTAENIRAIIHVLERMNCHMITLEKTIAKVDANTKRAANVADCIVNGVWPD